ncbi:type IV secretion system protein VirB3 [Alcaligenes faecalis subsp. faecalis NCIB 8687]|nr:type IV secretion system protein VirB3 [Alcaligenes faecalis subsp. faecalis NCIB 8687]
MSTEPHTPTAYPVFKGLGRKPTFLGVPTTLLFSAFLAVAFIAMLAGLAWWGLLVVVLPTIAVLTRHDDKAFDVLWLELKTRTRNRNKAFWNGSSYAPSAYPPQRPWLQRRTGDQDQ